MIKIRFVDKLDGTPRYLFVESPEKGYITAGCKPPGDSSVFREATPGELKRALDRLEQEGLGIFELDPNPYERQVAIRLGLKGVRDFDDGKVLQKAGMVIEKMFLRGHLFSAQSGWVQFTNTETNTSHETQVAGRLGDAIIKAAWSLLNAEERFR